MDGVTGELKDRAERLFGARKFRKSLQVYLELISRDATDPRLRVRAGELRRRLGSDADAARDYAMAAQLFALQGYGARARAALKIAAQLEPQVPRTGLSEIDVWAIAARPEEAQPSPRLMRTRAIELPAELPAPKALPAAPQAAVPVDTPERVSPNILTAEEERAQLFGTMIADAHNDLLPEGEFELLQTTVTPSGSR